MNPTARRQQLSLAGGDGSPPSHADILAAVERIGEQGEANAEKLNMQALTLQRVETKLVASLEIVGAEGYDEHGKPVGTGLSGRMMRLERNVRSRFRLYDDLRNFAIGFGCAASIFLGALWWVLGDKLGHLLKP